MTRFPIVVLVLACTVVSPASLTLLARQRAPMVANDPGMPTIARMYILNRDASESIPVTIHGGSDVQPVAVMSMPSVTLATGSSVGTRAMRQVWEYRRVSIGAGQDPAGTLNEAGGEGWEAVSASVTTAGAWQVLLKRPR